MSPLSYRLQPRGYRLGAAPDTGNADILAMFGTKEQKARYLQPLPLDAMLGKPGEAFKVAQARLGGGRIHHAMRTVGLCNRAMEMMLERAVSRRTQGKLLADHQFVQGMIADSAIDLEQFRLLVLKTAWIIDNEPHGTARTHIGMCKVAMAKVYHDIAQRAVHLHGALGTSRDTLSARRCKAISIHSTST